MQGSWTKQMKAIVEPSLKELAQGNKDIFAKITTKRAIFDKHHNFGEKLYKLTITAKKENPNFIEKILDKLGFMDYPSIDVTHHYHKAESAEYLYENRIETKRYKSYLNIK